MLLLVILVKNYLKWWAVQLASHWRMCTSTELTKIDGELHRQSTMYLIIQKYFQYL